MKCGKATGLSSDIEINKTSGDIGIDVMTKPTNLVDGADARRVEDKCDCADLQGKGDVLNCGS